MWATFVRLVRYGLVGLVLNLTGYLIYLVITWLGVAPKTAVTLLYGVGAVMGFFSHRRLSFGHSGKVLSSAVRYGVTQLCGYGLNVLLLYVWVDRLGFPHQLVQAAAIFIVAGFLFACFNFFVFSQQVSGENGRS